MKWFKHMTATRHNEKIAAYLDVSRDPMEAYGFWWMILETIAEQMEPGEPKCSVTYSLPRWSRLLNCHHHKVTTLLSNLEGNGLVTLQYSASKSTKLITVTIPNLLKYRDEYSRKSGYTSGKSPEHVRTRSRTDKDIEEKSHPKKPLSISQIPRNVHEMNRWAIKNGLPPANPGEEKENYRARLEREIQRINNEIINQPT